jgi:hypothetical protein
MTVTITEAIKAHGLEYLRGRAIMDGTRRLFINDKCLDSDIALWADEPENAYLTRRFYGSEVRNDPLCCVWIYGNATIADDEAQCAVTTGSTIEAVRARCSVYAAFEILPWVPRHGEFIVSHSYEDVESQIHSEDGESVHFGLFGVDGERRCTMVDSCKSKEDMLIRVKELFGMDLDWEGMDATQFAVAANPTTTR